MSKTLVGIEITEASVQVVEISRGDEPTILAAGEVALPPGAAKDSEIIDPQAVALAIRQLWQQCKVRSRHAVLGIGSRRVFVRDHTIPKLDRKHIREALPFQVDGVLPLPVDQAVLDFFPLHEDDEHFHGLLVAAVSDNVEALVATLRDAKVTASSVDLIPLGLSRVATRLTAPDETVAMVYVGYHTTYVVIHSHGIPDLVRIISIDLTTDDAAPAAMQQAVPQSLDASAVADLVSRIRSTLEFYIAKSDALPIDRVLLSGGGVLQSETRQTLAAALGLPSEVITVGDVAASKIELENDLPIVLVSTLGLALGGGRR
jgi:type IV pilus assembly protein PilM